MALIGKHERTKLSQAKQQDVLVSLDANLAAVACSTKANELERNTLCALG